MKNKILLTLILLIPSLCFGKKYITLKDPDYKNLSILVEGMSSKNNAGITKQDILNEIKLLCLQSGIKVNTDGGKNRHVYVKLSIFASNNYNDVYYFDLEYTRYNFTKIMASDTGARYVPHQGIYGTLGIASNKEAVLTEIRSGFKKFLIDYLESNIWESYFPLMYL